MVTKAGKDYVVWFDFFSARTGRFTAFSSIFSVFAGKPSTFGAKSMPSCVSQVGACAFAGSAWTPFSIVIVDDFKNELETGWIPVKITSISPNPAICKNSAHQHQPLLGRSSVFTYNGVATFTDLQIDCVRNISRAFYTLEISSPTSSSLFVTSASLRPSAINISVLPGAATQLSLESESLGQKTIFAGALIEPAQRLCLRDAFDNVAWNSKSYIRVELLDANAQSFPLIGTIEMQAQEARTTFDALRSPLSGKKMALKFCVDVYCGSHLGAVKTDVFDVEELGFLQIENDLVSTFAGETLMGKVLFRDIQGNIASASGISVRAMISSHKTDVRAMFGTVPELRGTTLAKSVNGAVRFDDLQLILAGNYTLSFLPVYTWSPGLDKFVASFSGLSALSNHFYVSATKKSENCTNSSDCILEILEQPGVSTAGTDFSIRVGLTDRYRNRIANRQLQISWGKNPIDAVLFGSLSATTDFEGLAKFNVNIKATCNRDFCLNCNGPRVYSPDGSSTRITRDGCKGAWVSGASTGGYSLLVVVGSTSKESNLIQIFPGDTAVNFWVNITNQTQIAGNEIQPVPEFWLLDRFGNLFDSRPLGIALEWEITHNGFGFLPCFGEDICNNYIFGDLLSKYGVTSCFGASETGYRPLLLRMRAPSKARTKYTLHIRWFSYFGKSDLLDIPLEMPTFPVKHERAVKVEIVKHNIPDWMKGAKLLGGGSVSASAVVKDMFGNLIENGNVSCDLEKNTLDYWPIETMQSEIRAITAANNYTVTWTITVNRGSQLPTLAEADESNPLFCRTGLNWNQKCVWPFIRNINFYFDPDNDVGLLPPFVRPQQCPNCPRPFRTGMLKETTPAFTVVAGDLASFVLSSMEPVYTAGLFAFVRFTLLDKHSNILRETLDGQPVIITVRAGNASQSCFECACNKTGCSTCNSQSPPGSSLALNCTLVVVPMNGYAIVQVPLPLRKAQSIRLIFTSVLKTTPQTTASATSTFFELVTGAPYGIVSDRNMYSTVYSQAIDPSPRFAVTDRHGNVYGAGRVITASFVECVGASCSTISAVSDASGFASLPPSFVLSWHPSYFPTQNFSLRISASTAEKDFIVQVSRRAAALSHTSVLELVDDKSPVIDRPMSLVLKLRNAENSLPVPGASISIGPSSCCRGPPLFLDCRCFTGRSLFTPQITNETGYAVLDGFQVKGVVEETQSFAQVSVLQITVEVRNPGAESHVLKRTFNLTAYAVAAIYVKNQPVRITAKGILNSVRVGVCVGDFNFPDSCDNTTKVDSLAIPFSVSLAKGTDAAASFDERADLVGRTSNVYLKDGYAEFDALNVTGPGSFRLSFSIATDTPMMVLSDTFNVEDFCAVHIASNATVFAVAGEPFSVVARALDFLLRLMADAKPKTLISWDPTCVACKNTKLLGRTTVVPEDGVATFTDLSVTLPDTYRMNVFFAGSSGFLFGVADIATIELRIVNAAPARLIIVAQPGPGIEGAPLSVQPALQVVDKYANLVLNNSKLWVVANGTVSLLWKEVGVEQGYAFFSNLTAFLTPACLSGGCGPNSTHKITFGLYDENSMPTTSIVSVDSLAFPVFKIVSIRLLESGWHNSGGGNENSRFLVEDKIARFRLAVWSMFETVVPGSLVIFSAEITGCNASINQTIQINGMTDITVQVLVKKTMCPGICRNCLIKFCLHGVCNFTNGFFEVVLGLYNETVLVMPANDIQAVSAFTFQVTMRDQYGRPETTPQVLFIEFVQGVYLGALSTAELSVDSRVYGTRTSPLTNVSDAAGVASFDRVVISRPGGQFQFKITRCPEGSRYGGEAGSCLLQDGRKDKTLFGAYSTISSPKFTVVNSKLANMNLLQDISGRMSVAPEKIVAGVRFEMIARLIDSRGDALGSQPYEIRAEAVADEDQQTGNTSGLIGRDTIITVTDFGSEYSGSAVFTDLALIRTGNRWRLRFTVTKECRLVESRAELCTENLVNFVGLQRPRISVPQVTMISVVHSNPSKLVFSVPPVTTTTAGFKMPTVVVAITDIYGNLATCTGPTDVDTAFIYAQVQDCRDPAFTSTGRFIVTLSLLPGCYNADRCDGSNLTDVSSFTPRTGETRKGQVEFSNLSIAVGGYNFKFLASVSLVSGKTIAFESQSITVQSLVYDFLEVSGCPSEKASGGLIAGSQMPMFTVLGVFTALSRDGAIKLRANTGGQPDPVTGIAPGVLARVKMCLISGSTGDAVCGNDMTPPLVVQGRSTERFNSDGMAIFSALSAPGRTNAKAVLIVEVSSPFEDGRILEYRCPPIAILEAVAESIQFLQQPHMYGNAGLILTVQPIVEVLDVFKNRVIVDSRTRQRTASYASLCGKCICPCTSELQGDDVRVYWPQSNATRSLFSPLCTYCTSSSKFLVNATSTANARGRHLYPLIRIMKSGEWKLLFSLVGSNPVYAVSNSLTIRPCVLKSLQPSQLTTFGPIQPGDTVCGGGVCEFQAKDAFGNLVDDVSLTLRASLVIQPDVELAAFTTPEDCGCTGVNTLNGKSPPPYLGAQYGSFCNAWESDNGLRCQNNWPLCTPGIWCCMSWCYVDKACSNALPDDVVPGLFYSYEACTSDMTAVNACPWQTTGSCTFRNVGSSALNFGAILSGATEVTMNGGVAVFTDLYSRLPGRFNLEILGFSGDFFIRFVSDPVDVQSTRTQRLIIVEEPTDSTFEGNPLLRQPKVKLADSMGNPVWIAGGKRLCGAVTASVVRWKEPGESKFQNIRYVYGQSVNDNLFYPKNCQNTPLDPCYVTATSNEGIAEYSSLTVGGGGADGVVLNFTSGCCNTDSFRCICSAKDVPTNRDPRYPSSSVTADPCVWVTSRPFYIKKNIAQLEISTYTSWTADTKLKYLRRQPPFSNVVIGIELNFTAKNPLVPGDVIIFDKSNIITSNMSLKVCNSRPALYPCPLSVFTVTETDDGRYWNRYGPRTSSLSWTAQWKKLENWFELHLTVGSHVLLNGNVFLKIDGFSAEVGANVALPLTQGVIVMSVLHQAGQTIPLALKLLDESRSLIIGSSDPVEARLQVFDSTSPRLFGTTRIRSSAGVAVFTDINIQNLMSRDQFVLRLAVLGEVSSTGELFTGVSQTFRVIHSRPASMNFEHFVGSGTVGIASGRFLNASAVLYDAYGNEAIHSGGMALLASINNATPAPGNAPLVIEGSPATYFQGSRAYFRPPGSTLFGLDVSNSSKLYSSANFNGAAEYTLRFVAFSDPFEISFGFVPFQAWRVRVTTPKNMKKWSVNRVALYDAAGKSMIYEGNGQAIASASASDKDEEGIPGYEPEQALLDNSGSWGGRPSATNKIFLGWKFTEPTRVSQVQILQAGPNEAISGDFATQVVVEARNLMLGIEEEAGWVTVLQSTLGNVYVTQILNITSDFSLDALASQGTYTTVLNNAPIFANAKFVLTTGILGNGGRVVATGIQDTLIAWEPFRVQVRAVDAANNAITTNGRFVRQVVVSAKTNYSEGQFIPESSLSENPLGTREAFGGWSKGCRGILWLGYLEIENCTAYALPRDAGSYPYLLRIQVSYCQETFNCQQGFIVSAELDVIFQAPVTQMELHLCKLDQKCKNEDDPSCDCPKVEDTVGVTDDYPIVPRRDYRKVTSPKSTHAFVPNEPYSLKPQIWLLTSAGKVSKFSKLNVEVYMTDVDSSNGRGCAKQFDERGTNMLARRTTLTAQDGKVTFNTIGTWVNIETCPIEFLVDFIFETMHVTEKFVGLIWRHTLLTAADTLKLEKPIPDLIAGLPYGGVTLSLWGRCLIVGCGREKVIIEGSVREVSVQIFWVEHVYQASSWKYTLPGESVNLLGTTTAQAVEGVVRFTDLVFAKSGTVYLQFFSNTSASTIGPIKSPLFRVSPGNFAKLRIVSLPITELVSTEPSCAPIELEITDSFGNLLDCEYGECPTSEYGYPELTGSRNWFLSPDSDKRVKAEFVYPEASFSDFIFADYTKITKCQNMTGSANSAGIRGRITFGCIVTGVSGFGIRLRYSAPSFVNGLSKTVSVISEPFNVISGTFSKVTIAKKPTSPVVAGKTFSETRMEVTDECANLVTTTESQGMLIFVEAQERVLYGDLVSRVYNGVAYFKNIVIRQAETSKAYPVRFYAAVNPSIADVFRMEVVHGPARTIGLLSQPQSTVQGRYFSAEVMLLDEFANVAENGKSYVTAQFSENDGCDRNTLCPSFCEGRMYGGTCYRLFPDKLTWQGAREKCRVWGGDLPSIPDVSVNLIIRELIRGEDAWIGLMYNYGRGTWQWINPVLPEVRLNEGYTSFLGRPPDDSGKELCIAFRWNEGIWESRRCLDKLAFVCTKKLPTLSKSDQVEKSSSCSCCIKLAGTTKVLTERGKAVFDAMYTFAEARGPDKYRLVFRAVSTNATVQDFIGFGVFATSQTFEVYARTVSLTAERSPEDSTADQPFPIQPIVSMLDGYGNIVIAETASIWATLELVWGTQDGFNLTGTLSLQSAGGKVSYTDLKINSPAGSGARAFVIRFSAMVGPVQEKTMMFCRSNTFLVMTPARSLFLDAQPVSLKGFAFAGDNIGHLPVKMLSEKGNLVSNSNAYVKVELLDASTSILLSDSNIQGSIRVLSTGGFANFTDLNIIQATVSPARFKLKFSVIELGLVVISQPFEVAPNPFVNLVFKNQPVDVIAGEDLSDLLIFATDTFGNFLPFCSDLFISLEFEHNGKSLGLSRDPQTWTELTILTIVAGEVVVKNLRFSLAANYRLRVRPIINVEGCREELELQRLSTTEIKEICNTRYNLRVYSSPFSVTAAAPSTVQAAKLVSTRSVAGEAFSQQPECFMFDRFGNAVTGTFQAEATARNEDGEGCLCDWERDDTCLSSTKKQGYTIQKCPGNDGCPVQNYGQFPSDSTSLGKVVFKDLACTRKTCGGGKCRPYNISCAVYAPPNCNPCSAYVGTIEIEPNIFKRIIPGKVRVSVAGDPQRGRIDSGFYDFVEGGLFATQNMVRLPPSFLTADTYGNINPYYNGVAKVSLASGTPDMVGYSFCTDAMSIGRTACLSGKLTSDLSGGLAQFPDLYVLYAGPGYKLEFEFRGVSAQTPPFHVLPSPPRVSGAYFDPSFTKIVVKFDVETNKNDMGGSVECTTLVSASVLAKLGKDARCSWLNPQTLEVVMGNNAQIVPDDVLEIHPNASIFTSNYFGRMPQGRSGSGSFSGGQDAGSGSLSSDTGLRRLDKKCARFDSWDLQLKSPVLRVPSFVQVGRPQRLRSDIASSIDIEDDVSVSDIELFLVNSQQFVLVLNRCKGPGCFFMPTLRGPQQKNDLMSNIYRWREDGRLTLHQALPTMGATDVVHVIFDDAVFSGGIEPNNFLVIANAVSDDVNTPSSVAIWVRERYDLFSWRQNITSYIDMPTSVAIKYHEYLVLNDAGSFYPDRSLLLVVANAGQMNAISIFKWVPGSYRAPIIKNTKKVWVVGVFDDVQDVQLIPTERAQSLELYHVDADLYLAVANSMETTSYRTQILIYKWTRNEECSSADKMCFRPHLSLPSAGARSLTQFSLPAPSGLRRDFIAIANQVEGDPQNAVSSQYAVDAFIYEIDYKAGTSTFLQALQGFGANMITVFDRCENTICDTYMAVANMNGECGPASDTTSQIYKWTSVSNATSDNRDNRGKFSLVHDVITNAALRLQHEYIYGQSYLVILTAGRTGVAFHKFDLLIPVPGISVDYLKTLGPCNTLRLDASSSSNSGGRDFTRISWNLVSDLPVSWQLANPGVLPYAIAKLQESSSVTFTIGAGCQSAVDLGCMNNISLPVGSYSIRLKIRNWIGSSAQRDLVLQKIDDPVPTARIVGGDIRTVYASQEVLIEGTAARSPCTISTDELQLLWTIRPTPSGVQLKTDRSTLTIPAKSLRAAEKYEISFKVSQNVYSSTDVVTVIVMPGRPVAKIDGSNRLVTLEMNKSSVVLLDASKSHIPGAEDMKLTFAWGCEYYVKIGQSDYGYMPFDCSLVSSKIASNFNNVFGVDTGRLSLPPSRLIHFASDVMVYTEGCVEGLGLLCDPYATYRFSVIVCDNSISVDACKASNPDASVASVVWSTTPQRTIDVKVELHKSLTSQRISNSMGIKLLGNAKGVAADAELSYLWVQMRTEGTHAILIPENMLSSAQSQNLAIRSALMQGAGSYRFRLYASLAGSLDSNTKCSGMCGWADIEVLQNMPPNSGNLVIAPRIGTALSTRFSFAGAQWEDEDLPLKYTFGYFDPDGIMKYIAVLTADSTADGVVLPPGSQPFNCTGGKCTMLKVAIRVIDALGAETDSISTTTLLSPTIESSVSFQMEKMRDLLQEGVNGVGILSLATTICEVLNQNPTGVIFNTGIRAILAEHIKTAVMDMLVPMSAPTAIHTLSSLWALCKRPSEIKTESREIATMLLDKVSGILLKMLERGEIAVIGNMPRISQLVENILGALLAPGASSSRRLSAANDAALATIANLEAFSRMTVAGHVLGQNAIVSFSEGYRTVTAVLTATQLSSFNTQLVGPVTSSSSLKSPQVSKGSSPTAHIFFPGDLSIDPNTNYEVQTTLLYTNPLWDADIGLNCLDHTQPVLWNSEKVKVPTSNFGTVTEESTRSNVVTYKTRKCSVLGNAVIINLRPHTQPSHIVKLGSATPIRFQLPFDPMLRNEVRNGVQDGRSGLRTAASCVYWDSDSSTWSTKGIKHVRMYVGDRTNGSGAYVECTSDHLSTFSVSEVPTDCQGTPFGMVRLDDCGVCSGDNSLCSGCDGIPNSGRSKDCSGHGRCAGKTCVCDPFYHGVTCQVYCESRLNCSGHGECKVEFEGLSMVTKSYCKCDKGFIYPSPDDFAGKVPVPTCVLQVTDGGEDWLKIIIGLAIGVPGLVLVFLCLVFWCCITRIEANKVRSMKEELDRFMTSYEEANGQEIDADLCMPLRPAGFNAPSAYGNEKPLKITVFDRERINVSAQLKDEAEDGLQEVVQSTFHQPKGVLDDSNSSSDEEHQQPADVRAERLRKIRAMRQSVALATLTGPRRTMNTGSDVEDVEVAV